MQSEDQFDDMDIVFAENDTAAETLRAANYLKRQLYEMEGHGGLTDEEARLNRDARAALETLIEKLEERRRESVFEDAPLAEIADKLDSIEGLSEDIYRELTGVESTIRSTGWPEPNPVPVANEHIDLAAEAAQNISALDSDDE